jgi:predicted transcriptional regulator
VRDGRAPKGQDVIVLLKLRRARDAETVRSLSAALGLPHAAVQRSLKRLESAGLYDAKRRRVNRARAEEFLVHAVKFMFPGATPRRHCT